MNEVIWALQNGAVVVASIKAGDDKLFNQEGGHIITITGINDDGTFHVNNPNEQGFNAFIAGEDDFAPDQIATHIGNGFVIIKMPFNP